jgi:uncharacterized membrane protein YesL
VLDALRVLKRGIVQFEHYGWLYVMANLASVALSIPIVTSPAAYAGLSRLSHTAQTTPTASFTDYWEGFRAHFRRGLVVAVANIAILGVLWSNFASYRAQADWLFIMLRGAWIVILVVWFGVQLYVWPILEEMEQPNLREALRNSAVMMLQNPIFTLTLLVAVAIIAVISVALVIPLFLVTGSMIACVANAAVLDRLAIVRASRKHPSPR